MRNPATIVLLLLLAGCDGKKVSLGGGVPVGGGGTPVPGVDGGVTTTLPQLPSMTNVVGFQREDSVGVDFDPVDGAKDYRIYPLPADADITAFSDGSVVIKNAIYRCAGLRQTYDLPNGTNQNGLVAAMQFPWPAMILANPTLGYVYPTAGDGRVPVYAVGVHPSGGEVGWRESRPKIYTTDPATRKTLLDQGGRDDGIVFYVPAAAGDGTQPIYFSETAIPVAGQDWTQYTDYYFTAADLDQHAKDDTPPAEAFQVLTAPADGTQPLMGVDYRPPQRHIELAVGQERYNRAVAQGPGPLWHLEWAPVQKPMTLVIEALDSGCPYQGFLSPQHLEAPPHQTFYTLDELQAAAADGEVFVNGQHDTQTRPKPIARAFIQVAPQPHNPADWDWYQGFSADSAFPDPTSMPPVHVGDQWSIRYATPIFDIGGYSLDKPNGVLVFTYGQFGGQFWTAFDDTGQDVTGTVRLSALQKASVDSDSSKFLHVTWTVDVVSTGRRYPQLIVSDQEIPAQDGFANPDNNTILIQTIQGPSVRFETQAIHGLVNGNPWAVNNQAKEHRFIDYDNWNDGISTNAGMPPTDSTFEHSGVDRMVKFDAYISSDRVYAFMDGAPAGCTQYPGNGFKLAGPVTVTFGDVLYHEGAPDEGVCAQDKPFPFLHAHQCTETKRHWDDLGFKSGVAAPTWDENKFPCGAY